MNQQQQRLKQLAEETNALRVEALKAQDINKLFDFADKAKEFEDAWISARGKKKSKPNRITNPYTGKKINKKGMRPSRDSQSYKDIFIEMSRNFQQNDFVQRLTRDFTPSTQEIIKNLIGESDEKIPELVDRYIQIQKQGVAGIEQMLTAAPAQEIPASGIPIQEEPEVEIPVRRGPGRIIPAEEAPSAAQVLGQNIRGAVRAGIDVARIPFDQLSNNLARRIMRPDLLPAPAMERRRGRGARDWRKWIADTIIRYGKGYLIGKTIEEGTNYLWHAVMGNTPKKNKAETEQILRAAGIVSGGTIDDALKTKENLEELFEIYKRERGEAAPEADTPSTPDTPPTTETPAPEAQPTAEVVMDSEEFQRIAEAAREVERRQREATGTQSQTQSQVQGERDPQPPPLTRPRVQYPDLRKGHLETIAMEQMLQQKKEEEDRRLATLYTQNPDDYMSPPVPNPYMRPMYSDEWVDIKRLQRLQTPEYTRKEQEIWARNYQTPYQMGEGTIDNSVKDIKNIVERIAQLEHRLRYDYATKGVPRDERQPGYNWGMPTTRAGRSAPMDIMPPEVSRYAAYLDVVDNYNMDKYQYNQRQNEPPRSRLINRDAVFGLTKPTPDIPSQQKIYDERMNEPALSHLDIQNDMDYEYFRRRIRKR